MEIKIISMEQALYLLAAVITIVSAMLTLVIYSLRRTRDPFLQFYVIVTFGIAVTYWLIIKWNFGPTQVKSVQCLFGLFGALALLTIAWRAVALYFYVRNPTKVKRPYGFNHGHTNFWPYFLLIIAWTLMTVWLTLYYSFDEANAQNRNDLFYYFFGFLIFGGFCRVAWHIIENIAITKISQYDLNAIKKTIYGVLRAVDLDHELVVIDIGENRRVHITDVPETLDEHLSRLLNARVRAEVNLDEGGPYRYRNISLAP